MCRWLLVGVTLLLGCSEPPTRPPPLDVPFTMKPVASAQVEVRDLEDGRIDVVLRHEVLRGVTAEMLVWFFEILPSATVEVGSETRPLYQLWHPVDHISVEVVEPASSGRPGFAAGARVRIVEAVGDNIVDAVGEIRRRDETGSTIASFVGPFQVLQLDHDYRETPDGVEVTSHLVLGSDAPLIGGLLSRVARSRFDARAWVKHGVEEFGNLEYILPVIYGQDAERTLEFADDGADNGMDAGDVR